MPMDRSLYPANWEEIARQVKEEAEWKCEECGRECRRPGESLYEFIDRQVGGNWRDNSELAQEMGDHRQRWCLTVAHLNHIPQDCDRSNLRALCSGCHLRYDAQFHVTKRRLAKERRGQLSLW